MIDFWEYLFKPYREDYTLGQIVLESIAVVFGIASVLFAKNRNIWVFPTGIISTSIYIYLLFQWGLYGDMLINFYYSSMSIYGWILWSKHTNDEVHISIDTTQRKDWIFSSFLFLASYIFVLGVYYIRPILQHNFDLSFWKDCGMFYSAIDFTDAFTTSIFLVGMWLMAKRKIENWLFWIVGNCISIPMYIVKGYALTSFQYTIFLVLAIMGYREWLQWKKSH